MLNGQLEVLQKKQTATLSEDMLDKNSPENNTSELEEIIDFNELHQIEAKQQCEQVVEETTTKGKNQQKKEARKYREFIGATAPSTTHINYDIDDSKEEKSPDPTDLYLKEVGITPLLSKEEEVYFSRLALKGDEKARKRMIESNLRLVIKIARRYIRSGMPILDLIEEGNLGLIKAVEKFDPERGFRFSTYGAWWIQQTIERAIMSQNRTIRLPVHIVKKLNSCIRTGRELAKELDHEPNAEAIADRMDKSKEEVEKLLQLNEKVVSIDTPISEEVNKPLLDTIGNNVNDPARINLEQDISDKISKWLYKLPPLQRSVIERRFGLNNHEQTTLEQTGKDIGLTRERVRQLQAEALRTLKEIINNKGNDFRTLINE